VAAAVAGWLVYERMRAFGPEVTIQFNQGAGLRIGQTPVKYRGVPIGEVTGVELSKDHQHVLVTARLRRSAAAVASEGAIFWIVRPQVGFGSVTGLNTVLSGPEIEVRPGEGEPRRSFVGRETAPLEENGLRLVLRAERPKSLRPNSPVYYRGIEVGTVQKLELSANAASADVTVLIQSRYAPLVREGSAFWDTSGISVKGGILKGLEVEFESLRALATGGVEFASPPNSPRAKPGTAFFLHDEPKKEWLAWQPKIPLASDK
ncbi:MAG TPA: MlaD family protein, partial [Steroidobacteraceae bacterium]|nr:MlaD family protein [Steroidobacteraceae bacterium]